MDFASSLGKFEGYGIFVEVSIELFHGEGVNVLACSVCDISGNEGFFKGDVEFVNHSLQVRYARVGKLHVPAFGEGTSSSSGQLAEEDHSDPSFVIIVVLVYLKVGFHHH